MDTDGTRADEVAGDEGRDWVSTPDAPLSPRQVDRAVRNIYVSVVVLGLSAALGWWSWTTVESRADDRTKVERLEPAAVPVELCDGLVDPGDVLRLRELRDPGPLEVLPLRAVTGLPNWTGCRISGGQVLSVAVAPVERMAFSALELRGPGTPGVLTGITGMAGPIDVWVARACPQIGPEQALLAYASVSPLRGSGSVLGDEGIDRRDVLTRMAVRALGIASDGAGCAGAPPVESVGSTPPPVPVPTAVPPDAACVEAAAAAPDATPPAVGAPTSTASVSGPADAQVRGCTLAVKESPLLNYTVGITTYRGLLAGIGAAQGNPGVIPAVRAEARCGGERVTWVGSVGAKFWEQFTAEGQKAVLSDMRSRFARFVDANVRFGGCQVVVAPGTAAGA